MLSPYGEDKRIIIKVFYIIVMTKLRRIYEYQLRVCQQITCRCNPVQIIYTIEINISSNVANKLKLDDIPDCNVLRTTIATPVLYFGIYIIIFVSSPIYEPSIEITLLPTSSVPD